MENIFRAKNFLVIYEGLIVSRQYYSTQSKFELSFHKHPSSSIVSMNLVCKLNENPIFFLEIKRVNSPYNWEVLKKEQDVDKGDKIFTFNCKHGCQFMNILKDELIKKFGYSPDSSSAKVD